MIKYVSVLFETGQICNYIKLKLRRDRWISE